uniref:Major facilitator superfamily (MFS) profile domain-containing protein n=1 Tax=Panagrolaimus sp. PS1159 TaxID=55785 RepID=A0AC35G6A0_9BILA
MPDVRSNGLTPHPYDAEATTIIRRESIVTPDEAAIIAETPEQIIEGIGMEDDLIPPIDTIPSDQKPKSLQNYGDFIKFGWYIAFFMIMYESLMLPQVGMMTFMVYGAYSPQVTACGNHTFEGMTQRDVCAGLDKIMNKTGCIPTVVTQFESVGHEMGLYCSGTQQVKRSVSIQMVGVFLGAPIFGQLSDSFGRRRVIQVCCVIVCILGFFAARAPTLDTFTIIQLFNMFFVGGMNTCMHVFLVENIPKRQRVTIMMLLSFSPNIIIFAIIAYYAQNWRTLITISAYLTIPASILLFFCFESPRWLIEKGKLEEANRAIRKIEKWNGTMTEERSALLDELIEREAMSCMEKKKKRKYYMYHLFYTANLTIWSLTIAYGLFCTAIISYAMVFNMEQFSGSIFMNNIFLGVFRLILNLGLGLSDYIFPKLGRKALHQGSLIYVISMISIVLFMKIGYLPSNPTIVTLATLSATALCSQLFVVNSVLTAELFPTSIRNIASSFISTVARFGGIVSPNLFLIEKYWIGFPYLVIVLIMSVNFVIFQFNIPETKGSPMSDHMPDKSERLKMWNRKTKLDEKLNAETKLVN